MPGDVEEFGEDRPIGGCGGGFAVHRLEVDSIERLHTAGQLNREEGEICGKIGMIRRHSDHEFGAAALGIDDQLGAVEDKVVARHTAWKGPVGNVEIESTGRCGIHGADPPDPVFVQPIPESSNGLVGRELEPGHAIDKMTRDDLPSELEDAQSAKERAPLERGEFALEEQTEDEAVPIENDPGAFAVVVIAGENVGWVDWFREGEPGAGEGAFAPPSIEPGAPSSP